MRNALIEAVEKKYRRHDELEFEIGDTVSVTLRITEGGKERLQDFVGTVIARRGTGTSEMFTVRKLIGDEGVERIFPIQTPKIVSVKVLRSGKVRRCKLYYLRDRVGKARKLRERRISAEARKAAADARAAKQQAIAEAQEKIAQAKGREALAATT